MQFLMASINHHSKLSNFWEILLCCQCLSSPRLTSVKCFKDNEFLSSADKTPNTALDSYSGLASFTKLMKALDVSRFCSKSVPEFLHVYILNAFSPEVHCENSDRASCNSGACLKFLFLSQILFFKPLRSQTSQKSSVKDVKK